MAFLVPIFWPHCWEQLIVLDARLCVCTWYGVCNCVLLFQKRQFYRKMQETGVVSVVRKQIDIIVIKQNQKNIYSFYPSIYHWGCTQSIFYPLIYFTSDYSTLSSQTNREEVLYNHWKTGTISSSCSLQWERRIYFLNHRYHGT